MNLPDGIIDSAELFLESMRVVGIRMGAEQDEADNRAFLTGRFVEAARKVDGDWQDNEKRYAMLFWTGALLGERIASFGFTQKLKKMVQDSIARDRGILT